MKTLSMFKVLPLVAASAALLGSGAANALSLTVADVTGGNPTLFVDLGDSANKISTGPLAYGWGTISVVASDVSRASGGPLDGVHVAVNVISNKTGTAKANDFIISVWDSFPTIQSGATDTHASGTLSAGSQVTYEYFVTPLGTGNTGAPLDTFTFPTPNPVNRVSSIGHNVYNIANPSVIGFDTGITLMLHQGAGIRLNSTPAGETTTVPIPAAALLFGSALLGMAGVGRRKPAQS